MSIHEFYSKFMSADERTPLFTALRRLSSLGDSRGLVHQFVATGWPSWDAPPQDPTIQAASRA